jgi:transposase-like protein
VLISFLIVQASAAVSNTVSQMESEADVSPLNFLFGAKRDKVAARRFFDKAIGQNGSPETVTIDKSGSNLAALCTR